MALCTRCGRQAEPGAEFCEDCAGNPAADAADHPMTAPAMAAAADYLRPFAAESAGPPLLPETQGPDYWTNPGIERIPVYQERAWASPSGEPPDLTTSPDEDPLADEPSYSWQDDQGYQSQAAESRYGDDNSGSANPAPPATYLPAPGQAFTVAGERYAPTDNPQNRLQPYGPADTPYAPGPDRYPIPDQPNPEGQDRHPIPGPPYPEGQDRYPVPGPPYPEGQDRYPVPGPRYGAGQDPVASPGPPRPRNPVGAEQYAGVGDAYPAYQGGERQATAGEGGYYAVGEPYEASAGYPVTNTPWAAMPPDDLTGRDPVAYPDPLLYPTAAPPTGPNDRATASPPLDDAAQPSRAGRGAGALRFFRRNAAPDAEPEGDEPSGAGLPGQPYAAAPHVLAGGPALAMAPTKASRVGADRGPRIADSEDDLYPSTSVPANRRSPKQGRWIVFAAAAVVLIIAAGSAAILLAHHSPAARNPTSGRSSAAKTAPTPGPTSSPLVAVVAPAASAPQAPAVEAFLTHYFTAINTHNFVAYKSLFGRTLRGGLSADAFARGYGSSQDSQATLHSISVPAAGRLVARVSFISHQQPGDSATHSACTTWTISLYLTKQAGGYVIQAPPAGYGATAAACS